LGRICAVIPACNEAERVGPVVASTRPFVDEVVVIDDGSRDGTADVAAAAGARVISHETNRGKSAAIETGLSWARGSACTAVVMLDADGQHDPAEIPRLVEGFRKGADIVLGTRMYDRRDMPGLRAFTNFVTSLVTSCIAGRRITDSQSGFRLFRMATAGTLVMAGSRFEGETEVLVKAARKGMAIREVPITTIYGTEESKINPLADTGRFIYMALRLIFFDR
jgi:glycosyltransferase involved in cell wall biosynthesis